MKYTPLALAIVLVGCTGNGDGPDDEERGEALVGRSTMGVLAADSQLDALQIVDGRSREAYDAGHIPGALHMDGPTLRASVDGVSGQALPSADAWVLLEEAGIDPTLPTLVYGDENDTSTARTYWSLALYGAQDALRLLDGGLAEWEAEGLEVSTMPPSADAVSWQSNTVDESLRVDKQWVLDHLDDADVAFFDVRSSDEYDEGHIPGAQNVEWTQNLESGGLFASVSDTLALHGDPDVSTVVVYCQSGARASVSWALLDAAGLNVRLYDGSWNEWGTDPDTPKE